MPKKCERLFLAIPIVYFALQEIWTAEMFAL